MKLSVFYRLLKLLVLAISRNSRSNHRIAVSLETLSLNYSRYLDHIGIPNSSSSQDPAELMYGYQSPKDDWPD